MKKLNKSDVIFFLLFAVCVVSVIVCSIPDFTFTSDEKANVILIETIPRVSVGIFLIALLANSKQARVLNPISKNLPRSLVWCIPCLLVALANFPFSALITGSATLERVDLVWLFLLQCLSVGLMEELFFRGLLLPFFLDTLKDKKYSVFLSVVFSSACFSLMHLFNLFLGASINATMLQIGYTFLIGCMFAVTFLRTGNVWLCVLLHAIFNFGGGIVTYLGRGAFQDTLFWIFTLVAGIACTAHILLSLRRLMQSDVQNPEND